MGAFYDKLRGCVETDTGIDCGDGRATPLARMVYEVYGGPYYNAETCPAGSEPPHPSLILEALAKGAPIDLLFTSEEKDDFGRFATEEYEKAHAAWTKRIQKCGEDPGGEDGPPPKGKPVDADSLGALALIAIGFLVILWARKKS